MSLLPQRLCHNLLQGECGCTVVLYQLMLYFKFIEMEIKRLFIIHTIMYQNVGMTASLQFFHFFSFSLDYQYRYCTAQSTI